MLKTFRRKNYTGNAGHYLPLCCRACGKQILEGQQIHSTRSSSKTNYLCQTCYDKPVLVYPLNHKKPKATICLHWKPCKHTGEAVTTRYCTCLKHGCSRCIWKLTSTLDFIKSTKMKPWELYKMKNKYQKQAIPLG